MRDYADPDDEHRGELRPDRWTAASPEVTLFPQAVGPIDGNLRQKRSVGRRRRARRVAGHRRQPVLWRCRAFTVLADMRKD
jgi:hypothetical protein